jgi:hypothetical protein
VEVKMVHVPGARERLEFTLLSRVKGTLVPRIVDADNAVGERRICLSMI